MKDQAELVKAAFQCLHMTEDDEKLFVVTINHFIHKSGLMFDLLVGWMLCTPRLRTLALVSCVLFHTMTTQMFNIGMFPFVSLCLLTLWLRPSWTSDLVSSASNCCYNCFRWVMGGTSSIEESESGESGESGEREEWKVYEVRASCVGSGEFRYEEQFPALPETMRTTTRTTKMRSCAAGEKVEKVVEKGTKKETKKKTKKKTKKL